ncbi:MULTISPECIES: DUF6221 family protein [unclassified Crossiella]|uniref:DUF6221 family protein n=1 Tax=unclassified Crossiella TaxID=2620835 RepID=UPI001FFE7546|nr:MULTISPECIES: DUF6221 family protein [unclassified Crossiella]MCK2242161.1 DUF6221 family protein [Crossiella sp. S99.2]MCK2256064.1 DUF6221 family protein [Crossiella sp. S99.1]
MDLIDFIRARLTEDEAEARQFDGVRPDRYEVDNLEVSPEYVTLYISPARVLRDVAAARELLDLYIEVSYAVTPGGNDYVAWGLRTGLDIAVRLLVTRWADHPDYLAEWRPQ